MRRVLAMIATLVAPLAVPALLTAPAATAGPAAAAAVPASSSCLWFGPTFTADDSASNYAFPDSGARYWAAHFAIPAGATLQLRGTFAHARYQSLNSYNATTFTPVDAVNDVHTAPDAGSTNPYLPGARRAGDAHRDYTVTVAAAPLPGTGRTTNTLYAGVDGQAAQLLIYRVYLPDRNRDVTGGAGLPAPVLTLADGSVLTGDAACTALASAPHTPTLSMTPLATYNALRNRSGMPATFPATDPVQWRAFYNAQFTLVCAFLGQCGGTPARVGGQYSNIDNNYVYSYVNRGFGKVLVLHGKLPTTPGTIDREPTMDANVQLRYWSLCSNESAATTRVEDCVYDEQVPTDADGRYTIVVSRPEDRPAAATAACGVAWLRWPERGDGEGHLDDGFLIMRNMLPAASFHQAVQDTRTPGDEKQVMGDYLPDSAYTSPAAFDDTHRC